MTNTRGSWQIECTATGNTAGPINNPQAIVGYSNDQGGWGEGGSKG